MFALRRAAIRAAPLSARPAVRSFSVFGARLCKYQCHDNSCVRRVGVRTLWHRQQHATQTTTLTATRQTNFDTALESIERRTQFPLQSTHSSLYGTWHVMGNND
jgi:hypothetical protein